MSRPKRKKSSKVFDFADDGSVDHLEIVIPEVAIFHVFKI